MIQSPHERDYVIENELDEVIPLNGSWTIDLGEQVNKSIHVPSAWETTVNDWITEGPAVYRRSFVVPLDWQNCRCLLQAGAISFAATIKLNGRTVGEHTGMWASFQVDITADIHPGINEIEIDIWKPGKHHPMRQSLAGFLPDVATTFGGIWQDIFIRKVSDISAYDIHYVTDINGNISVIGKLNTISQIDTLAGTFSVTINSLNVITKLTFEHQDDLVVFRATLQIEHPRLWSIGRVNNLVQSSLEMEVINRGAILKLTRNLAFRHISTDGAKLRFNGDPVHLRGVLDWGWDQNMVCPTPTREQVVDQIQKSRALGFNMLKLCLFVPDDITFNLADELGMPLWLELPMWLPDITADMRKLALREYDAILSRVHHHPSLVIVSLGCELQHNVSSDFLLELSGLVSHWMPNVLRCDNSGSAEAYGGVQTTLSDFDDYHFYTDPHHFQSMVDHFERPYRTAKPWIYGEFCDADTARDYSLLSPVPWWLVEPLPLDREELTWTRDYHSRYQEAGVMDQGAELTAIARRQATAVRKFIFEQVRRRHATGGYVITGWMDTPIATSGVVDDNRQLKYDPGQWRHFNNDVVLLLDHERRRYWKGGDRPVYTDPHCFWQADSPEFHILLSNGQQSFNEGSIEIEFSDGKNVWPVPAIKRPVEGGMTSEIATFNLPMHVQDASPFELTLRAKAKLENLGNPTTYIANDWTFVAIPDKERCLRQIDDAVLFHQLTPDLITAVRNGENAVVWMDNPDSSLVSPMPFWREAIHVFAPHPFWRVVPHPGYADMRFYSVATDFAIDPSQLRTAIGNDARIVPIWRRFDARRFRFTDYVTEVHIGNGCLYISTLRFAGGSGHQPDRLKDNPMGAWLLKSLLDRCATPQHLHQGDDPMQR